MKDGDASEARFYNPRGLILDSAGDLYVADYGNNRIRKVTPAGVVSTFAGSYGGYYSDGAVTTAQFNGPSGITQDSAGNFFVADTANHRIRKITPGGIVSTFAGSSQGFADGTGTAA